MLLNPSTNSFNFSFSSGSHLPLTTLFFTTFESYIVTIAPLLLNLNCQFFPLLLRSIQSVISYPIFSKFSFILSISIVIFAILITSISNKINNNLEQQAQTIFKSWFIDFEPFDGHKPSNWKFSILGEVSQMGAGGDKPQIVSPSKTEDCPYPIYSNGLSNEGLYGYTNYAKIFEESVTVSARGTIGFVSLRHIPYVPIVRLVTLIPKKEILSAKYLFFWLKQLHITGTGTTQQQLTVPAFQKTEILVPSLESIASFDEIVDPIYQKIWSNQSENEHLAAMRDALLPKLMSGELDVSDIEL